MCIRDSHAATAKRRPANAANACLLYTSGDFVLFHAAAGGVGLIACQWAKAMGLQLIGTAGSDAKCALAKANGAAFAINYVT